MRLDQQHLRDIARDPGTVPVPDYPRSAESCGIVHIGVGGFHRAHQAMYVDRLLRAGRADGWGICGVGLMPGDVAMRDALREQNGLYTLTLRHPDGTVETQVMGAIMAAHHGLEDPEAVLEVMAAPQTRIVSLTVTEGGYNVVPATGEFDADEPHVRADLEPGATPTTSFGFVAEALRRRRDRGLPSFTLMSCDNIQHNGEVAREMFLAFARLKDPALADWIAEHTRFPSSMVDRITPASSPELVADVERRTGIADRVPVVAEPFTQWVLEDSFADGRPPFEEVGVQVVDDVEPYELMKLRLLNGSHQALAYFGHLLGHHHVHDAAADPDLQRLVRRYMDTEAEPTLPPVPGVDLAEYKDTLVERFTNTHVADTIRRLCAESSDRIPKWVVPVIRAQLAQDRPVDASAAIVASWTRYAEGTDEQGRPIEVVDRLSDRLGELAHASRTDPLAFVRARDLFGDLADDERFTTPYLRALETLRTQGARATLQALAG